MISFSGRHFHQDMIMQSVRWYLAYSLSYRNIEEIMVERGFHVDHSTINRWVVYYAPKLEQKFHKTKKRPGDRWRLDESYIKVKGSWVYYYRAVDKQGNTIDFLLTKRGNKKAALRFLNKAIGRNGKPGLINIDKSGANKAGIKSYNAENNRRIEIRQCKYLNNIVEHVVRHSGHRNIKRITGAMLGFKNFWCAQATLKGIELMAMLKKGQQRYSAQSYAKPAEQFYALAG